MLMASDINRKRQSAMLCARSLAFNGFFWLWAIILMVLALPVATLGGHAAMRRYARFWMHGVQAALKGIVGLEYRVRGVEHLPAEPVIIASKHQSAWETLFYCLVRAELAIALKQELTLIPLFGWYVRKARNIELDRGGAATTLRSLIKGAKKAIAAGDSILIFPEGTRKLPGDAPDYKPGVAALYAVLGAKCVPVALNSGCFWKRRSFIKRPGVIDVEFLPPIAPGMKREQFMQTLERSIETATARLVADAQTIR